MGGLILVGIGGFIGAILRYVWSGIFQSWSKSVEFPYGTLAVNVLGCLVIGFLTYLVENRGAFSPEARLMVLIGILGAFTTFSAYGVETFNLLRSGQWSGGMINLLFNNLLGLLAVWLGRSLGYILWR